MTNPNSPFSPAFWEHLHRLGATPEQVVRHGADVTVFEAAAQLKAAEGRIRRTQAEVRLALRGAEPVRETPAQAAVANSLRSGWTC